MFPEQNVALGGVVRYIAWWIMQGEPERATREAVTERLGPTAAQWYDQALAVVQQSERDVQRLADAPPLRSLRAILQRQDSAETMVDVRYHVRAQTPGGQWIDRTSFLLASLDQSKEQLFAAIRQAAVDLLKSDQSFSGGKDWEPDPVVEVIGPLPYPSE